MFQFPEENLKSIRVISKSIQYPIAIACYSADDEELVTGLESIIPDTGYSLADVIAWCKDKGLRCWPCQDTSGNHTKLQ